MNTRFGLFEYTGLNFSKDFLNYVLVVVVIIKASENIIEQMIQMLLLQCLLLQCFIDALNKVCIQKTISQANSCSSQLQK